MEIKTLRVGMLRQWLNEDRGCTPLISNADILYWLAVDNADLGEDDGKIARLRKALLADPRAEAEGNQVWNAVVNQVLKLTEPKDTYGR